MTDPSASPDPRAELARLARQGADSVFRYVERGAEPVEGGVRWRTLDDAGRPQYRGDLYSNGGIPLFLADYARLTGQSSRSCALELAAAGAAWCSRPGVRFLNDHTDAAGVTRESWGLIGGRAGLGLAWWTLHEATGEREHLTRASDVAEHLMAGPPGPHTDFSGGAAGHGVFLLRLWERTRETRHLEAALARAAWLEEVAIPYEGAAEGCSWRLSASDPRSAARIPLYAGVAGTGYFLLLAYAATRDQRWEALARAAAATLIQEARPDRGGLSWLPEIGATHDADLDWRRMPIGDRLTRCQWCSGAPGVGLFFTKAYELLGDARFLEIAEDAGEATYAYGDGRGHPTYCHGLAGNTELLIELARVAPETSRQRWLERALEHARRLLGYQREGPDGEWWPSDDPTLDAPDFLCGAAGTGHVFLRLLGLAEGTPLRMALL